MSHVLNHGGALDHVPGVEHLSPMGERQPPYWGGKVVSP